MSKVIILMLCIIKITTHSCVDEFNLTTYAEVYVKYVDKEVVNIYYNPDISNVDKCIAIEQIIERYDYLISIIGCQQSKNTSTTDYKSLINGNQQWDGVKDILISKYQRILEEKYSTGTIVPLLLCRFEYVITRNYLIKICNN